MLKQEAIKTWKLSAPIILGELTQMSLGLIDSAMVGAISYQQLAASALVNSIIVIPFVFGIGLTMSVSQKVASAHGRSDGQSVSHYLYNGFWLCTVGAVMIAFLLVLSTPVLFHLKQDADVARLAAPYMRIIGWSIIPSLMFMAIKQFTDGLEKTKIAMYLSLAAMPINAFLNWLLIYGHFGLPRLELAGAALGTLITRLLILIALILVVLLHPLFWRYIAVRRNQWKIKIKSCKELLQIGIPSGLQAILETGAFSVSAILVGTLGAVPQAAHQIALQCASFTFMISLGLAQGSAIRIGNAFGRKNWAEIKRIGRSSFYSAILYGLVCMFCFIVFRKPIALVFNNDAQVVITASTLMIFAAVFQISDAAQTVAVGCLRGINDVKMPMMYMAIAYWIIGVPAGCLFAFVFHFGAKGVWMGFVLGLTTVAVLLNKRFSKMTKTTIAEKTAGSEGG